MGGYRVGKSSKDGLGLISKVKRLDTWLFPFSIFDFSDVFDSVCFEGIPRGFVFYDIKVKLESES